MKETPLTIPGIFTNVALRFSKAIALQRITPRLNWQRFTYKELEEHSLKVATFLLKAGLRKGEQVALILENRPEWAIIYLGISRAGLVCVPLDPQLTPQELKNLIVDSTARILFCSQDILAEKIGRDIREQLTQVIILDAVKSKEEGLLSFEDLKVASPDRRILPTVTPQDTASLIYTSGTTGQPKGVVLTHKNICSNFRGIEKFNICRPSDNILSVLPLYHTYSFMVSLIMPLFSGARVTYFNLSFKSQDLSSVIKEGRVTILPGVPQLFSLVHKAIFDPIKKIPSFLTPFFMPIIKHKVRQRMGKSLGLLISGGARFEPQVACDLSRLGFKVIEGYGLTETSPVVTLNPPQNLKFGSVGRPIPGVQIKINHPDKSGIGEVLIKGPNVMAGYFKQPGLTSQVIKDDWFYSGDLGYQDKDGYLFLTGREKDVIVLSSGKNIYPEELEEHYQKSPYITEICILPRSEERFGRLMESLYAVIVPDLEYFQKRNEKDIRERIRWELENLGKRAPSYKHVMGFMLTKEPLPRTALKKIKRHEVKKQFLEEGLTRVDIETTASLDGPLEIPNKDIARKIIYHISNELKKPVSLGSHLEIDLGIDSLSRVELELGLERLFSIKIPEGVLYDVTTVGEVIIKVSEIIEEGESRGYAEQGAQGQVKIEETWPGLLSRQPQEGTLQRIRIEPSFLDKLITWFFKNSFLLLLRIFWSLKIEGRKNLPSGGPYLICPNHASYLDGIVVFSSLPLNCLLKTFFVGFSKIFQHPLIRWAIKLGRLIPLDPNINLTEAMSGVNFVLSKKKAVCIFPEGRRSVDGSIGEFKKGVGILIKEADLTVIPVYIKGSHRSWPRGSRLPRFSPLKIVFGRPIYWKELIKKAPRRELGDDYQAISQGLREEVVKLKC